MRSVGLVAYTIRVNEKYTRQGQEILSQIANEHDLLANVREYLELRKTPAKDAQNQRLLRVSRHEQAKWISSGLLEKGEYGTRETLVNVDTFSESYVKRRVDAPLFPHYFQVTIPRGSALGILVLERSGQKGVFSDFSLDYDDFFRRTFPAYTLTFSPILPKTMLGRYVNRGEITKIRLVRFRLPKDFYDRYDLMPRQEELSAELVISGSGLRRLRGRLRDFIREQSDVASFIELKGYRYEDVKVEIKIGDGKHRVISIAKPLSGTALWDITQDNDLRWGDDGHPTYESIHTIATEYVKDVLGELGI